MKIKNLILALLLFSSTVIKPNDCDTKCKIIIGVAVGVVVGAISYNIYQDMANAKNLSEIDNIALPANKTFNNPSLTGDQGALSADQVTVNYDSALTNRISTEGGVTRPVTAEELGKAIEARLGFDATLQTTPSQKSFIENEVIPEIMTDANNFVVDGKPSLTAKEWMDIAENNLGLTGRDAQNFVNDIGLKLESGLNTAGKTSWSQGLKDVMSQIEADSTLNTKNIQPVEIDTGLTINPVTTVPELSATTNSTINNDLQPGENPYADSYNPASEIEPGAQIETSSTSEGVTPTNNTTYDI